MAGEAAQELGCSTRYIYQLLKKFRQNLSTSALIPASSAGGKGKSRIKKAQEKLLNEVLATFYCTKQRPSVAETFREIQLRARSKGIKPPSLSTVLRRVNKLDSRKSRRRGEQNAPPKPSAMSTLEADRPLAVVQIDHTPVDLILVDEEERKPIGRPYLTLAVDVYSRCVAGIYLSLDRPSATSVALCITSIIADKAPWLAEHGIDAQWPIRGKPWCIHVDNGAEFHSEAFERGCSQHGIRVQYRPPGRPNYGGVVERLLGTLMSHVHGLPGTTFSSVAERGKYASEKLACLTLSELEKWLLTVITRYYHETIHKGLGMTPAQKLAEGQATDLGSLAFNAQAIVIDFLPIHRRVLQREGIILDHIVYYDTCLNFLIHRRMELGSLLIRRDPRDLSRIFVHDPDGSGYMIVPCRNIHRPSINLIEHRAALRRLKSRATEPNEDRIFDAIAEMRAIPRQARSSTLKERKTRESRRHGSKFIRDSPPGKTAVPGNPDLDVESIKPFPDVELWS
jgi:putative transposase